MKRLTEVRDLFESTKNETITITIEAKKLPYQVTFSDLESGGQWTSIQTPTPQLPVEVRSFKMPAGSREFFAIVYAFPPNNVIAPGARYRIKLEGAAATSDGPNPIPPPFTGSLLDLSYEFRLPAAPTRHFMPANLETAVAAQKPIHPIAKKKGKG